MKLMFSFFPCYFFVPCFILSIFFVSLSPKMVSPCDSLLQKGIYLKDVGSGSSDMLLTARCGWVMIAYHRQCKGRYALSVKLSDFNVWRHIWWKNWVNCAVLIGNSAGLRTDLSSRLSHTQKCAVHSWNPTVSSVYLPTPPCHTHEKTHRTDQKTDKFDGKPVLCQRTFSSVFRAVFFKQLNCTV